MSKANLEKNPAEVAAMFDEVAPTYDMTNALLSFGQDARWRKIVRSTVNPKSGQKILDLAAGTGASSASFVAPGVKVVASDFSQGMLAVGRVRHPDIEFVFADATALPFTDGEFDCVTISFGLRNVVNVAKALSEMYRVTKPGGTIVICEFSKVSNRFIKPFYEFYLNYLLPGVSRLVAKNHAAYGYLAESIMAWPDQNALATLIGEVGFKEVTYKNLTFGVVAVHSGTKAAG